MTPLEMHTLAVEYYEAKERGEPFDVQYIASDGEWYIASEPVWDGCREYRRKPDPRVLWVIEDSNGLQDERSGYVTAHIIKPRCRCVKFVEEEQ